MLAFAEPPFPIFPSDNNPTPGMPEATAFPTADMAAGFDSIIAAAAEFGDIADRGGRPVLLFLPPPLPPPPLPLDEGDGGIISLGDASC